ncbi:hypothetical protein AGMMS49592_0450 [Endomicrobiia bacterium]|nr:hypothetical protein AGMMS49592_0450 [Endomicrobiia bacterium]
MNLMTGIVHRTLSRTDEAKKNSKKVLTEILKEAGRNDYLKIVGDFFGNKKDVLTFKKITCSKFRNSRANLDLFLSVPEQIFVKDDGKSDDPFVLDFEKNGKIHSIICSDAVFCD